MHDPSNVDAAAQIAERYESTLRPEERQNPVARRANDKPPVRPFVTPTMCHADAQRHHASTQPAIPPDQHGSKDTVTSVVNMGIVPVSVGQVVALVL